MGKLRQFHSSLDESGQAMLGTILEGAQAGDTGGYAVKCRRYGTPDDESSSESSAGWNDP